VLKVPAAAAAAYAAILPDGDGISGPDDLEQDNKPLSAEELQEGLRQAYEVRRCLTLGSHILSCHVFMRSRGLTPSNMRRLAATAPMVASEQASYQLAHSCLVGVRTRGAKGRWLC
jgi:hypothetical protein